MNDSKISKICNIHYIFDYFLVTPYPLLSIAILKVEYYIIWIKYVIT